MMILGWVDYQTQSLQILIPGISITLTDRRNNGFVPPTSDARENSPWPLGGIYVIHGKRARKATHLST
jgi:hypothetical protein